MPIDPLLLSTLTAGVSLLGNECLKGFAGEAGKSAWKSVKNLLGWKSDPSPAEIQAKVSDAIATSPQISDTLIRLLQDSQIHSVTQLVGKIEAKDNAKVIVAHNIEHVDM